MDGKDGWVSAAPGEGVEYRLADDHPEAIEDLRELGYTGEVWIRARCLTERESQEYQSICQFSLEGETEELAGLEGRPEVRAVVRLDHVASWEYLWSKAVVDARIPIKRDDGIVEYQWDRSRRGQRNKNLQVMGEMQPGLAAWAKDVVTRASARQPEQQQAVEQSGN